MKINTGHLLLTLISSILFAIGLMFLILLLILQINFDNHTLLILSIVVMLISFMLPLFIIYKKYRKNIGLKQYVLSYKVTAIVLILIFFSLIYYRFYRYFRNSETPIAYDEKLLKPIIDEIRLNYLDSTGIFLNLDSLKNISSEIEIITVDKGFIQDFLKEADRYCLKIQT